MFSFGKSPAKKAMDKIVAAMNRHGNTDFQLNDEGTTMFITKNGSNFDGGSETFCISVDEDGLSVAFYLFSLVKGIPDSELAGAYAFCNHMNDKYRWVRVHVDKDNDLTIAMDAVVEPNTVGEECVELIERMARICNDIAGEVD